MESVCLGYSPKRLKANYCVSLLHISIKKIKYVDTDKTIPQFHVGYIPMTF